MIQQGQAEVNVSGKIIYSAEKKIRKGSEKPAPYHVGGGGEFNNLKNVISYSCPTSKDRQNYFYLQVYAIYFSFLFLFYCFESYSLHYNVFFISLDWAPEQIFALPFMIIYTMYYVVTILHHSKANLTTKY